MWYSTSRSRPVGRCRRSPSGSCRRCPGRGTPLRKNGGSIRQPQAPTSCAWRVSSSVSGSGGAAGGHHDARAGMPPADQRSTASCRSAIENDGPSPVVPKGVTPAQPRAISARAVGGQRGVVDAQVARQRRQQGGPDAAKCRGGSSGRQGVVVIQGVSGSGGPRQAEHAKVRTFNVVGQALRHGWRVAPLQGVYEPEVLFHRRNQHLARKGSSLRA